MTTETEKKDLNLEAIEAKEKEWIENDGPTLTATEDMFVQIHGLAAHLNLAAKDGDVTDGWHAGSASDRMWQISDDLSEVANRIPEHTALSSLIGSVAHLIHVLGAHAGAAITKSLETADARIDAKEAIELAQAALRESREALDRRLDQLDSDISDVPSADEIIRSSIDSDLKKIIRGEV